jgi:MFS family permease
MVAEMHQGVRVSRKNAALLTASLVSLLIILDSNIVAVSLPAIGRSVAASFTDIQWVISAYGPSAALFLATGNYADLRDPLRSRPGWRHPRWISKES